MPYKMGIIIPVLEIQIMNSESLIRWSRSHTINNEKKKEQLLMLSDAPLQNLA